MSRCKASTTTGKRCAAHALTDGEYCAFHEPALATVRRTWRSQGGRKSSKRLLLGEAARASSPEEVRGVLAKAITAVEEGRMDEKVAGALARLCSIQLRAIREADFGARLKRVEDAIAR